jgi:hypothetical protein
LYQIIKSYQSFVHHHVMGCLLPRSMHSASICRMR